MNLTVRAFWEQRGGFDRYPGAPVLHMVSFRITKDEVRESVRLASQLLGTPVCTPA